MQDSRLPQYNETHPTWKWHFAWRIMMRHAHKDIHHRSGRLQLIAFLVVVMVFSVGAGDKDKKEIQWLDFEAAVAAAKKHNRVLVVDFYTDWCGWCKVMDKKTYGDPKIIDYAHKNLIMSKVNAESSQMTSFKKTKVSYRQLAQGFQIRGYPATIFIDENGEFMTAVSGYLSANDFMPILEFLAEGHYKSMKYEEYLAKRKNDS